MITEIKIVKMKESGKERHKRKKQVLSNLRELKAKRKADALRREWEKQKLKEKGDFYELKKIDKELSRRKSPVSNRPMFVFFNIGAKGIGIHLKKLRKYYLFRKCNRDFGKWSKENVISKVYSGAKAHNFPEINEKECHFIERELFSQDVSSFWTESNRVYFRRQREKRNEILSKMENFVEND